MTTSIYNNLKERFPRPVAFLRKLLLGETGGVKKVIRGQGNVFESDMVKLSGVTLDIQGDNNQIRIAPGCVLSNVHFRVRGSGHRVEFGAKCRVSRGATIWIEDTDCVLQVDANTTIVEAHIAVTENCKVLIGEDCMFANDIDIRTGDSHSVVEVSTGRRLNFAGDVIVGRHVWIAPHTVILKGVSIGENSIVATGSIVTKSCEPGVILGGNPAKVLKSGVTWSRRRLPKGGETPGSDLSLNSG
jgi:acetyltransferase-like isoleucine patch superfamily enzyme